PPAEIPSEAFVDGKDTEEGLQDFRGKSFWFNILPSDVNIRDIWPKKSYVPGEDKVTVLDYVFMPDTPGVYNVTPNLADPSLAWGGAMKLLSSTANNLVEENIEFVEMWVKVVEAPEGARLGLDMGRISEDVIPNGKLDREDLNDNYIVDEGEDRGLDGLTDSEEKVAYESAKADPANDNFRTGTGLDRDAYFDINNPEGNAQSTELGRFPDTEDLNNNGTLDQLSDFFRYDLPLDTSASRNPFIAGGGDNDGWYLYRIPIKDFAKKIGSPDFTNVTTMRFFVTGVEDVVHLRITDFNLVGNQWRKPDIEDTIVNVTVVSVEDNPEYIQPPGVKRERDRSQTEHEIYKNEQSLALRVNGLPYGEKREITKTPYKPLDLFNYSELKLFVHGDEYDAPGTVSYYVDENSYAAEVYFRFGTDTNHYYEYRQPVRPGWNEIAIVFDDLTALKQARDSVEMIYRVPVPGKAGHTFAVKGNPSLTSIKTMAIGIENVYNPYSREGVGAPSPYSGEPISGEVWVNELRVIGADDTPGWSYRGASSLKIADILTLTGNYSRTDPFFHRVAERFGSRQDQQSWNASASVNVMNLIPYKAKGSSLNVNYSHTENIRDPLYLPGTDVQVEEAKRLYAERLVENGYTPTQAQELAEDLQSSSQTLSTTDTWSISNIRLLIPTDYWLADYTWNALTYNFTYNTGFQRDPTTIASTNWSWNASADYGISFNEQFNVTPPEWPLFNAIFAFLPEYQKYTVSLLPQSFSAKMSAKRNRNERVTRPTAASESNTTVSRDFTAARGFSYQWKITQGGLLNINNRYSVDINSSLAHLLLDAQELERENGEIFEDIFNDEWFGRDQNYRQTFDISTSPQLPTFFDLNRFFTLNAGYNVNYDWQFNFSQEELGRSARFANSSKIGMKVRLKALLGPLFEEDPESSPSPAPDVQPPRDRRRDFDRDREPEDDAPADTTAPSDTTEPAKREIVPSSNPLTGAFKLFKGVTEYFFVDYENIGVDYTNRVSFGGGGLAAKSHGFGNFWGFAYDPEEGPSRLFMLGLDSDLGPRAAGEAGAQLTDQFSEDNSLAFTTSRQLWEGATINLNWKLDWGLQKQTAYIVQPGVDPEVTNVTSTGKLSRSFITMPPAFFLSVFKSGITSVAEQYNPDAENPAESLSDAFVSGFETMPWLSDFGLFADVAKYIPRANWSFTWTGLEKFPLFQGFAQRVTLDHAYTSDYTEAWKFDPDGNKIYTSQKISYGFSPLFGLNMTFKNLWDGNFTGSFKYSTRTNYDLTRAKQSITEALNQEIGFSLSYSKSGFEAPLFGVALKNDIEFSLAYSISSNSSVRFDMNDFTEEGTPQDGTATTTIEPRVKYVLSSRVTLSVFYKRVDIEPEGSSTIQPSSRNEAGVDVRISIQ
ncbi:MAG: cell surface protein SprA, partial [Ignavibacteriales bacterium]|nr:cell surface protein SprA [Ignavibacteriales bacterium]